MDADSLITAVVCPEGPLDYTRVIIALARRTAVVCPEGPLDYTLPFVLTPQPQAVVCPEGPLDYTAPAVTPCDSKELRPFFPCQNSMICRGGSSTLSLFRPKNTSIFPN